MANAKHTDEQVNEFLDLAQEVGITKAMRELGYPRSWSTAQYWAKQRGVEVAKDPLKAQAAAMREVYKDEEVATVVREGFNRVYEELTTKQELSADEQKKLSEAANKYYQMWASLNNKASNITETRSSDSMDESLQELLNMERAKNMLAKEDTSQTIFTDNKS